MLLLHVSDAAARALRCCCAAVALLLPLLQHVDAHVPMGQCPAPSLHQILANALARALEWELVLLRLPCSTGFC